MNVNNKIVFLDGQFPAIIFPVGSPQNGGSCRYLTEHCLLYCPAKETNTQEKRALGFFEKESAETITEKILKDLSSYGLMHLYWWSWGDCLPELTDKITYVMTKLSKIGVLQNGFTRNPVLWENINTYSADNLKIGGHVDDVSEISEKQKNKIICCPDVNVGKAELYFNKRKVARCCGIWCDWLDVSETRSADCQECYIYKQGCFYEI